MKKYKVEGTCYIEAVWSDNAEQRLEVIHKELELREETEIDAIYSGAETVSIDFEIVVEADSEKEAKEKIVKMLEDVDSWDATTLIGGEEISTDIIEVEVEILKVEKVE